MIPDHNSFAIVQFRIGALQIPCKLAIRSCRTGVNLNARRMCQEHRFVSSRSLDGVGNRRGRYLLGDRNGVEAWKAKQKSCNPGTATHFLHA
jgi:hypothetical protein